MLPTRMHEYATIRRGKRTKNCLGGDGLGATLGRSAKLPFNKERAEGNFMVSTDVQCSCGFVLVYMKVLRGFRDARRVYKGAN